MRLSCPGCQTEYEVPDAALAGRVRTLRCANCGHQWEYGPLIIDTPADPAEAAWPGAAPRSVVSNAQPAPEIPEPATPPSRYEPLDPPTRETWPPPESAEPAYDDTIITEPALAEPETEPAAIPAESQTKPAAGNEERFAALVRTSRNETDADDQPRPSVRAGLFTTIILLIGIAAGIWAARFHIMQIWPPSTRLFNTINTIIANLTIPPHH